MFIAISATNRLLESDLLNDETSFQLACNHPFIAIILAIVIIMLGITAFAFFSTYRRNIYFQEVLLKEQDKLKRSYQFSRSILDAIPDELFRINIEGEIIPTLELPEEIAPISSEYTYIGQNIYQLWHYDFARRIADASKLVIATKFPDSFEFKYVQNGVTKWFNIQMVPFGEAEVLTSIRDLTEHRSTQAKQKESEFMFQTQFDFGTNGIGILTDKYEWKRVNHKLAALLGYTTEEFKQLTWQQVIIPEDLDYDLYIFSKFRETKHWNFEGDKRFLSKTGEVLHMHYSIVQYNDPILLTKLYIVTFQDITFRKEHERNILNAILETEEKERTNFAQEIHDGLGPILSSIKMYFQWFEKPETKISKEEILRDIDKLISDAQTTVREVSFHLSPHVLKNFGLIASLQTFASKLSGATDINFTFDIENPKQRFDESTEVILYRALTECINNTIKYAKASNTTISIKNDENSIIILYIDDGIGFNAQEVLTTAKGTGLYNIQNRLKAINGECHFLGSKGNGTKIMFKINT